MSDFLELLLGGEGRARLVKFFILNPVSKASAQELKEKLQVDQRRIKTELDVLVRAGVVKKRKAMSKNIYFLNRENLFYPDLKKIVAKCTIFPQLKALDKLSKLGHIKLVLVTGVLANNLKTRSDILIVGDGINRSQLSEVVRELEAEIGRDLRFTTLTTEEYEYRLNMFDKFIREFFEGPNKIIFNRLGDKGIPTLVKKQSDSIVRR
jgi:hypothetical protein